MNDKYFLDNNLFDTNFLEKLNKNSEDISNIFDSVKSLYNRDKFIKTKEATLEIEFIHKVFELLGYDFLYRERISFQGQSFEPDNTLFASDKLKDEFVDDKAKLENILLFCESKAYQIALDNTSKDKKLNPHYQLLDYLKTFKIDYGFLTNGRKWRFYDNSIVSTTKTFYEIDLEAIIDKDDMEAFGYFYFIFRRENFYTVDTKVVNKIVEENNSIKKEVENDLKNVIYGTEYRDSIFEIIGKNIYKIDKTQTLHTIYQNTLYLIFRLLFIAYFEDKNRKILSLHKYYNNMSLNRLYTKLQKHAEEENEFNFYGDLRRLFRLLNEGDESYEVPLFNGGLFNIDNAHLLEKGRFLSNKDLYIVLNSLLVFDNDKGSQFRRDFKNLSIINLGSIYEGLLEYRFEIAQKNLYYVEYKESKKSSKIVSGYMDSYDYGAINKAQITKENYYKAGELYLTNSSNSRKSTASYYTPTSLSSFMVKSAIDLELSKGKKPIELKIIDNSCGSGHFLLESLSYLTEKAIISLPEDTKLQAMVAQERVKIQANLIGFKETIEVSDYDILKRLLLKKSIFGVDLNPFSVELTKLALWIDSLIFGTPLSFLSHHIKQGNSLIGSKIEEFNIYFPKSDGLFQSDFISEFDKLNDVYKVLDNIQDTTAEEINLSKQKYEDEIKPKLDKLNLALNLITLMKFQTITKEKTEIANIKADTALVEKIFKGKDDKIIDTIREYTQKYSFFNYEVEFPEVTHKNGFDIVIGNPPWDVVKLDDRDFFSQYRSNYRTLKASAKKELQLNLLDNKEIKEKYDEQKTYYDLLQKYFKLIYTNSAGVGNNQNFFRFFIERNLSLLTPNGSLTYLTPSAIISEDGSATLREYIFNNQKWNYAYSFENREKHFNDVDSRFKYIIFQIENSFSNNNEIKTRFMQHNPKILNTKDKIINYDLEVIKKLSPTHLAFLEFQDKKDLTIIEKMYSKFETYNTEYLDFNTRELNLTEDKHLFQETKFKNSINLLEGKMFWQFNSKFDEANYFLNYEEFKDYKLSKEINRFINDIFKFCEPKKGDTKENTVLERLQLSNRKDIEKYIKFDSEYLRIGFRLVASNTNERTLIMSMIPKDIGAGNSVIISYPKKYILKNDKVIIDKISSLKLLFLNAVFNSFVVDYILRFLVDINVNKTYFLRLPISQPDEKQLRENSEYQKLIINSLKLTLYYNFDDFKSLATEYNISKKDLPQTDKQVDMLKIENDIIVAKMYGISYEELEHILSTFKVFNRKNPHYIASLLESF
ncbi:MAG: restriction endonuclease [Sulfurovum sp.]